MEGRVPRTGGGSKQTAPGTKKLHDFHEKRARKQKHDQTGPQRGTAGVSHSQGERGGISFEISRLPLGSSTSPRRQPPVPQPAPGKIRAAEPAHFAPR